jgi:putative flippase GtrA
MISDQLRRFRESALARQVWRFALAGVAATAVHFAVLIALVEWGGLGPVLASTIAYCFGVVVSFSLNRRFTFEKRGSLGATFAKYAALYAVGIFLNGAIMAALIAWGLWYILAQIIAVALILSWNFLGARYIVFR